MVIKILVHLDSISGHKLRDKNVQITIITSIFLFVLNV